MAEIIPFPKKEVKSKLDFEDVVETALTVTAVNLLKLLKNRWSRATSGNMWAIKSGTVSLQLY